MSTLIFIPIFSYIKIVCKTNILCSNGENKYLKKVVRNRKMNKSIYALKLNLPFVRVTSPQGISRFLHVSPVACTVAWRRQKGLPVNKTARGPLTDLPDFSFKDGRPTPIMSHQKHRMLKQREYAAQIVKLSSELDFAVEREKKMIEEKEQERRNIIENRLKPKGQALLKK